LEECELDEGCCLGESPFSNLDNSVERSASERESLPELLDEYIDIADDACVLCGA